MPAAASSIFSSSFTTGTQPPQPVPADVHAFSAGKSWHPSPTAARTAPAVTLLHEHSTAPSGMEPTPTDPAAPPPGATRDATLAGVGRSPRAIATSAS